MREEKKADFKCRICGCEEYEEERINPYGTVGVPGKNTFVLYHYCKGCSNIFKFPENFSAEK
jgi:predicted nucleic-acid-binding Zn-ribbon protein